jgi:type IV pilus assembly protein PilA
MLLKLRKRIASDESGFTLIELLVVMLIIGILAAIAIPTFFNQKQKAQDSDSKAMAHTAQTAIETYATDNGGSYAGADATKLNAIEATVPAAGEVAVTGATSTGYTITVTNPTTKHTFTITRAGGGFTNPCGVGTSGDTLPAGGCPTNGNRG